MIINKLRLDHQLYAIQRWRENKGKGAINVPKGYGVHTIMALAIDKIIQNSDTDRFNIYVLLKDDEDLCHMNYVLDTLYDIGLIKESYVNHPNINYVRETKMWILPPSHTIIITNHLNLYNKIIDDKSRNFYLGVFSETYTDVKNCICNISLTEVNAAGELDDELHYNILVNLTLNEEMIIRRQKSIISNILSKYANLHKDVNTMVGYELMHSIFSLITALRKGYTCNGEYVSKYTFIKYIYTIKGWNKELDLSNKFYKMINDEWSPVRINDDMTAYSTARYKIKDIVDNSNIKKDKCIELVTNLTEETGRDVLKQKILIIGNKSAIESLFIYFSRRYNTSIFYASIKGRPVYNYRTLSYYVNSKGEEKNIGKTTLRKQAELSDCDIVLVTPDLTETIDTTFTEVINLTTWYNFLELPPKNIKKLDASTFISKSHAMRTFNLIFNDIKPRDDIKDDKKIFLGDTYKIEEKQQDLNINVKNIKDYETYN